MKCPNCSETLLMSDKNGIEIDYCPSCRGIWLDRGELDKIIERSAVNTGQSPYGTYSERDGYNQGNIGSGHRNYDSQRKPYKKKDSFLGDLFDF